MDPKVIYEDNHLIALYKPAGWLVQGDSTGDKTITDWGKDYLKIKYDKPGNVFLHPVHRLDRPVSGLLLLGRTSKGLERMTKLFREDKIQKTYLAIVNGQPEETDGTLRNWLVKDSRKNVVTAFNEKKNNAKEAILSYKLLSKQGKQSLLLVSPKTGRPHQIRVQLSKIGCQIEGDVKYGAKTPHKDLSISLHAFKLQFAHPVKDEKMSLICKPLGEHWNKFSSSINELE